MVITADEAAATPAGMPIGARDYLAAKVQSPFSVANATAAIGGAEHLRVVCAIAGLSGLMSLASSTRGGFSARSTRYAALPQQTQEIRMIRTAAPSLTAEDWNGLYASGRVTSRLIGDGESRSAHRKLSVVRGMSAVDLGCGTGKWTRQLAAWGLDTIGLDFSQVALEQARAAVSRARYELWDIDNEATSDLLLPGSIDIVSCRLSFSCFDQSRLLPNVRRWMAPRGRLYILTDVTDQHDGKLPPYECGMSEEEIASLGSEGWHMRDVFRLNRRAGIVLQPSGSPDP
ncbi:class I SAM-dependent methyltransferase [Streptomyces sp. DT225]